jgi:hypothetical protein
MKQRGAVKAGKKLIIYSMAYRKEDRSATVIHSKTAIHSDTAVCTDSRVTTAATAVLLLLALLPFLVLLFIVLLSHAMLAVSHAVSHTTAITAVATAATGCADVVTELLLVVLCNQLPPLHNVLAVCMIKVLQYCDMLVALLLYVNAQYRYYIAP